MAKVIKFILCSYLVLKYVVLKYKVIVKRNPSGIRLTRIKVKTQNNYSYFNKTKSNDSFRWKCVTMTQVQKPLFKPYETNIYLYILLYFIHILVNK